MGLSHPGAPRQAELLVSEGLCQMHALQTVMEGPLKAASKQRPVCLSWKASQPCARCLLALPTSAQPAGAALGLLRRPALGFGVWQDGSPFVFPQTDSLSELEIPSRQEGRGR